MEIAMTPHSVIEATSSLDGFCSDRGWRYCFIGGIALQRWGEQRMTRDADMTLLVGWGNEEPFVDELLKHFAPRVENARAHALRHRVLLLKHPNGTPLDVGLGGLPFEERAVERGTYFKLTPEFGYVTCSAEDLVVHKVFAGRPQDWVDVRSVLVRQADELDFTQIETELTPLLDLLEMPERLQEFNALKRSI